jgi:hypothetical protein
LCTTITFCCCPVRNLPTKAVLSAQLPCIMNQWKSAKRRREYTCNYLRWILTRNFSCYQLLACYDLVYFAQ